MSSLRALLAAWQLWILPTPASLTSKSMCGGQVKSLPVLERPGMSQDATSGGYHSLCVQGKSGNYCLKTKTLSGLPSSTGWGKATLTAGKNLDSLSLESSRPPSGPCSVGWIPCHATWLQIHGAGPCSPRLACYVGLCSAIVTHLPNPWREWESQYRPLPKQPPTWFPGLQAPEPQKNTDLPLAITRWGRTHRTRALLRPGCSDKLTLGAVHLFIKRTVWPSYPAVAPSSAGPM